MTMFKCHCGEVHDNAVQGPCPQTFTLTFAPLSPDETGLEIRRLLLALRAPEHGTGNNYATDALRRRALEVAGICWLTPGEMAPMCCCEWSQDDPTGAAKRVEEDHAERRMLWAAVTGDACAVSRVSSRVCAQGTRGCVAKHGSSGPTPTEIKS